MKIALLTANLNNINEDVQKYHIKQELPKGWVFDIFNFTDENFPPRTSAMTPRLQAKLPKILGWQLIPDYDFYIWMDSYFTLSRPDTVQWLVDHCENSDIALFPHPDRDSIKDEWEYMLKEIKWGNSYLIERYENEPLPQQVALYLSDTNFVDDKLYAGGVIVYKNNKDIRNLLLAWMIHIIKYSIQDQLSLPYVLSKSSCNIDEIEGHIMMNHYIKFRYKEGIYEQLK